MTRCGVLREQLEVVLVDETGWVRQGQIIKGLYIMLNSWVYLCDGDLLKVGNRHIDSLDRNIVNSLLLLISDFRFRLGK